MSPLHKYEICEHSFRFAIICIKTLKLHVYWLYVVIVVCVQIVLINRIMLKSTINIMANFHSNRNLVNQKYVHISKWSTVFTYLQKQY